MHTYTVAEVAQLLGRSVETVRAGLILGKYPFGTAIKPPGGKRYNFVLYPKKVEEYVGDVNELKRELGIPIPGEEENEN